MIVKMDQHWYPDIVQRLINKMVQLSNESLRNQAYRLLKVLLAALSPRSR